MSVRAFAAERVGFAQQHYRHCLLCEHRCGVDRLAGDMGACLAGGEARVYRHRVECGEEIPLIPSHLIYLSGCNLRCAFCIQAEDAENPSRGRLLDGPWLNRAIRWGRGQGARNLQWVGGEPTIHLPAILGALVQCSQIPPLVWKSNFFASVETWELLNGLVDCYVADFKFGQDGCARRIAGVERYVAIVTRNLLTVAGRARLIVRHLLLPGHFDCCYRPIVAWLSEHLPGVSFSVREGYLPRWHAWQHEELRRPLEPQVARRAWDLAAESGLNVIS